MGLNIGLYLRRSEVLVRKPEVLVRKSEVLVRKSEVLVGICLCKQETHVEDSPRALVKPIASQLYCRSLNGLHPLANFSG